MTEFEVLNDLFEKQKDFNKLFSNYEDDSIRYALLRSLDTCNIKEFLADKIDTTGSGKALLKKAYNSNVTIAEIENYIMTKKEDLLNERRMNENILIDIVENMDIVNCGVRNDQVDNIIKDFVRRKDFTSVENIENELDENLLPRIKNYIYWSSFNQISNDLIENSFYEHPSIIPTLRKIHDIDFFIKINGKIIPFDLKITHISDEFFNCFSKGLEESDNIDSYNLKNEESEIVKIKNFYRQMKPIYNLKNYGGLSKLELIKILKSINDRNIKEKVDTFYEERNNMIDRIKDDIKPLEWWNYKYQGERLFSNNNRMFVFLVYKNSFTDGKDIKKEITDIRAAITSKLDNLTSNDIHKIKYLYQEDVRVNGEYEINCVSILITKE